MLAAHRPASFRGAPTGPYRQPISLQAGARPCRRRQVIVAASEEKSESRDKTSVAAPAPGKAGPKDGTRLTELDLIALQAKGKRRPPKVEWPVKRSFLEVAWDQAQESVEDISSHLKRQIRELPSTKAFDKLIGRGDGTLRLEADRPVVLLLGFGWGSHSIVKVIDTEAYEVVCVSPRNHFLFTPMLPSTSVGTVEFRSLLEPVRVANPFVDYFEAAAERIDLERKVAYCTSTISNKKGDQPKFEIPYDVLVVAVGEQPATFGTPGVAENAFFMKEVSDAVALRLRIQQQFELAALPGNSEADMEQALHFVVVGGGPTGVEFAGTLSDFVREDLKAKYPELMPYVRVTLLNSATSILTTFDDKMQKYALENFKRVGVEVRTGVRVTEVTDEVITLKDGEQIRYGVCVWSAGNAPRPLVQQLAEQIPAQAEHQPGGRPSKLAVDPFLRVIGARDVLAIGDCSLMVGDRLPATAQVAGQQGAYAAHMINRGFEPGVGGMDQPPPSKALDSSSITNSTLGAGTMGSLVSVSSMSDDGEGPGMIFYKKPFEFLNLGALAYIGGVYITKQVSFRNRVLILFDWLKAQVFGRDLSSF